MSDDARQLIYEANEVLCKLLNEENAFGEADRLTTRLMAWLERPSEASGEVLATEKGLTPTGQHIADYERDAARYRWLREQAVISRDGYGSYVYWPQAHHKGVYWLTGSRYDWIDEAVNAAMLLTGTEDK